MRLILVWLANACALLAALLLGLVNLLLRPLLIFSSFLSSLLPAGNHH